MSEPARNLDPGPYHGPDNSPSAARARGAALLNELDRQGVEPEALERELSADDAAAVLAWLRGEGPRRAV